MKAIDTTVLTSLERAVYGTNLINRLTIENLTKVLPQLETYKHKKVCLVNGAKAKTFNVELLSYTDSNGQVLRTHIHFERNSVYLKQDVTVKDRNHEGGGYGVTYSKTDIVMGSVDNGVLKTVDSLQQLVQSYGLDVVFCAKEVEQTKDRIEQLKSEVAGLEGLIYPFKNNY
jgi:hypothetical protein